MSHPDQPINSGSLKRRSFVMSHQLPVMSDVEAVEKPREQLKCDEQSRGTEKGQSPAIEIATTIRCKYFQLPTLSESYISIARDWAPLRRCQVVSPMPLASNVSILEAREKSMGNGSL